MIIIVLFQASAINTRGHLQTQPSCPGGSWLSPALCLRWLSEGGIAGSGWVRRYLGAQPHGGTWGGAAGSWGCDLPSCTPGLPVGGMREQEGAGMLQGDASREDKGNILPGCNVNRAGAEPLFMESLSCQGICQDPDLRSYLDKGAGAGVGGAELASKSQDTPGCRLLGTDKEVAKGPGPKPQPPSQGRGWVRSWVAPAGVGVLGAADTQDNLTPPTHSTSPRLAIARP